MHEDILLDTILRERYVPEMPTNLAYRIIEAAKPRGAERGFTWAAFQRVMAEIFVIPQPAFAMVAVLVLGAVVGAYYTSEHDMTMKMAQDNFSSVITAELSVDYGDFL